MIDQINRMLAPLQRRIMLSIGRCILNAVQDGAKNQVAQVSMLSDEVRDNMERMAEYGFTSVPLPGAQGVSVFVGGERGHGVVIATGDSRYRLTGLEGGEVALYTDEGDKIVLKRGRVIEFDTETLLVKASTKVRFETPMVEATGDIKDNANTNTRTMAGVRTVYNTHNHNDPQGGAVGVPNQGM